MTIRRFSHESLTAFFLAIVTLALASNWARADQQGLKGEWAIRVGKHTTYTRVVFDLPEAVPYRIIPSGPQATTIGVTFLRDLSPDRQIIPVHKGLVREVNIVSSSSDTTAEIRLTQSAMVQGHFPLEAPPRIVIDIAPIHAQDRPQPRAGQAPVVRPSVESPEPAKHQTLAIHMEETQAPEPLPPESPASPPERQEEARELTLQQSIEITLQRNLRVRIARLTRDSVQPEVPKAQATFHPTAGLAFIASGQNSVSNGEDDADSNTQEVAAFISQQVPTGASVVLLSDLSRDETEGEDPPREFRSALSVSVVQPLLRGGGFVVATRPIRDAEFDLRIEEARLKAEILRVIAQAKSAYYTAILAEQIIALTEEAIQRDKMLLEASKSLFEAGLVTKRDVFSAELSLAKDTGKLVDAQANLKLAEINLLDTLGLPIATRVVLLDKDISLQPIPLELDKWITTAIKNRPELLEFEDRLGQSLLNIRVAKNTLFPQVDLVGSYERSQSDSTFGKSTGLDGEAWSVGLVFSVPIGNVAAKSDLIRAKSEHTRLQKELLQTQRQIELEVRANVIRLRRNLERIKPLTVETEQANGKLEIARARFALGEATNLDITDAQEDLLDAQSDLLEAIVDYNIALAELEASIAGPV
ncbi:MAG: TolC family protein [Candidatus Tectomicrobia bacterium]|nr:TolC family protein [Candidatus Tectomicrobia bacterium]